MSREALRLLIADDEPLARDLVRRYAADQPGVLVVSECASGDELARALPAVRPDVALLDIRMPGTDVFTVLEREAARPERLPAVIFSTAFDSYAVRAFDLNAVDYLVKPYTADRFAEGLRRARSRQGSDRATDGLVRAIRDLGPRPDRLLVPDGRKLVAIAIDDIIWIKAEDDYARVHTNTRNYLISRTLKDLEARLDPDRFVRVHRSALVQASHIREVVAEGGSRYRVRLSDGTNVLVSRTRAPELKRWMI
ncbi:MAG TPA: LytTR family DNA-binding domain-containing protein [Vicinamibacterales bacterium]|nr:LytTR family DNA-binding domain-containing protein [Vicinamibacterales bacterium]